MRLLLPLLLLAAAAPPPADEGAGPAGVNFSLPVFAEDGSRTLWLRAASARPVGTNRIDVADMNLTLYRDDGSNTVDTILLASNATFRTDTEVASGSGGVRLIRNDFEASGDNWTYDHRAESALLEDNVKVTFNAQIGDILK